MPQRRQCVIVGAGLCGLVAARALRECGVDVLVVDKGRGVGGRLASRSFAGARFDYGAQFFTVRSAAVRALVDRWVALGLVAEWAPGFRMPDGRLRASGDVHYRGVPDMRAIATHLAQGLDVRSATQVTGVARDGDGWMIHLGEGEPLHAGLVILTSPVPQSLVLLDAGGTRLPEAAATALAAVDYDPCITVLALLDGPSQVPPPGGVWFPHGATLSWIADNTAKGVDSGAAGGSSVTIQAGPEFSRQHFEDADEAAGPILEQAARWLGSRVKAHEVHRWRYSRPRAVFPEPLLRVDEPGPLLFAGDAFGGPRFEGAMLSGLAAAASVRDRG